MTSWGLSDLPSQYPSLEFPSQIQKRHEFIFSKNHSLNKSYPTLLPIHFYSYSLGLSCGGNAWPVNHAALKLKKKKSVNSYLSLFSMADIEKAKLDEPVQPFNQFRFQAMLVSSQFILDLATVLGIFKSPWELSKEPTFLPYFIMIEVMFALKVSSILIRNDMVGQYYLDAYVSVMFILIIGKFVPNDVAGGAEIILYFVGERLVNPVLHRFASLKNRSLSVTDVCMLGLQMVLGAAMTVWIPLAWKVNILATYGVLLIFMVFTKAPELALVEKASFKNYWLYIGLTIALVFLQLLWSYISNSSLEDSIKILALCVCFVLAFGCLLLVLLGPPGRWKQTLAEQKAKREEMANG